MEVLIVIAYASILLLAAFVPIWSGLALSPYIKEGKSIALAFTLFWIFAPEWFTAAGKGVFRKERRRVLIVYALLAIAIFGPIRLLS